jgi:curved DNA-binding protein CbpA
MFATEDKPKLNPQKTWKGFPSDPVELLLLAHVNGNTTVRELSGFCARTVEQTVVVLDRLAGLGIISGSMADPSSASVQAPKATPAQKAAPADSAPATADAPLVDRRFLKRLGELDTSVLSETVDLEPRRKEEVLLLYHSLSQLTPFQLFGVPGDASDRDVKRAYQRLSLRFHPDRYYGKNLGSFKPMMEKIFRVISESLELLSTEENRQRLAAVYPEAFQAGTTPSGEEMTSAEPTQTDAAEVSSETDSFSGEHSDPGAGQRAPRAHRRLGLRNQIANVLSRANSNSMVSGDSEDGEEAPPGIVLPPPGGYRTPPSRLDPIHRAAQERAQRVSVHLAEGRRALDTKNYGTAASHFKTALSLDPKHEEASRLYQEADAKNRETMGTSFAARARMEEEMRDLQRASELWGMAAEMHPTSEILMAAAQCFSKINNHAKAREYAQRAAQGASRPEAGLVLARVYLAAGMGLRAQSTLKELAEKFPGNPEVQRMLREAQKMK